MLARPTLQQSLNLPHVSGSFFTADWPAPPQVRTLITTRQGGFSGQPYGSLNLGAHVGDDAETVARNRALVQQQVPLPLAYLHQIHGSTVVRAADSLDGALEADASVDAEGAAACAVMTADCLPVLLCDRAGTVVAAAHAGWRGLAGGVLHNTVAAMKVPPTEIMAYLGPAIGAEAFEVGQDVYDAFAAQLPDAHLAFQAIGEDKYLADIYKLARQIFKQMDVAQVYGGNWCTVLQRETFFSYRRDGQTGRMISAIWLQV